MAIVKVWNDNVYTHTEKYKGKEITIHPGEFVEMDYIDAVDFRGQFVQPVMKGPNNPDPRSFKMIRVEEPLEPVVKADPNVFHATGDRAATPAEIIALAKAYASLNPTLVADDPAANQTVAPNASEIRALLDRIAVLEAKADRAKPGPKPKAKEA
jgi:hypothetical protein